MEISACVCTVHSRFELSSKCGVIPSLELPHACMIDFNLFRRRDQGAWVMVAVAFNYRPRPPHVIIKSVLW